MQTLNVMNALNEQDVGFLSVLVRSSSFPEDLPENYAASLMSFLVEKVNSGLCVHSLEWLEYAIERYPKYLSSEQKESLQGSLGNLLANTPTVKTLCKFKGKLELNPEAESAHSESEDMEYELFSDEN